MKKQLLYLTFLIFPLISSAQDPSLYKGFTTKVRSISTLHYNDELSIMLINIDNASFDVVGINDKMSIVWKTSLSGQAVSLAKFKDKVIVVAGIADKSVKGNTPSGKGFIIDPQDGKIVVEKTLYNGSTDHVEYLSILINKDVFYGIAVRESSLSRETPTSLLFANKKYQGQARETQDLFVLRFDEKLDTINCFKPTINKSGKCLNICVNNTDDIFISWLVDGSIKIYRYGFNQQPNIITADVPVSSDLDDVNASYLFDPLTSDRGVINYGLLFLDSKNDNKNTLYVGSINTITGQQKKTVEVFDKNHAKAVIASFVKPNEKTDDPDLGDLKTLHLKYLREIDGTIITAVASQGLSSGGIVGSWVEEKNIIINGYNNSLDLKFQQLMPSNSRALNQLLSIGFYPQDHKLNIIVNDKTGLTSYTGLLGMLDISSGKWDKITRLSKKDIDGSDCAEGSAVLWFTKTVIVPYLSSGSMINSKHTLLLQQNNY